MENKTLKKKVRFTLPTGSQRDVQSHLEERRVKGFLVDQLPIINNGDVLIRLNQFKFTQKDIRPVTEDSAWSMAVYKLHAAARKRIMQQRLESTEDGEQSGIYPFRLRFIGEVKGVESLIVAEKPTEIKSDQEFEYRLKEVVSKYREFLAALVTGEKSMLFDFELTMQTIEYFYTRDNVQRLD